MYCEKDYEGFHDKSDYRAAIRSVQRYCDRQGFERGKKKSQIRINPTHIAKRNECLRKIIENRAKAPHLRLCEVYTDESYVHQNHRLDKYNLHHPNDRNQVGQECDKGRRFCFVSAIRSNGQKSTAGLIPGSTWIF